MEKNNKESKECEVGCGCDSCEGCCEGHHHGFHKHFMMRWILGVVILVIVFWLGVKVGEFKGYLESNFGGYGYHRSMMYNDGFYPNNMMYWGVPATGSSVGTTNSSTTVIPKK